MTVARTRPAPIASPARCWCANGRPTLYATWRNEQLVAVTREHLPVVCGLPVQRLDPIAFERGAL